MEKPPAQESKGMGKAFVEPQSFTIHGMEQDG